MGVMRHPPLLTADANCTRPVLFLLSSFSRVGKTKLEVLTDQRLCSLCTLSEQVSEKKNRDAPMTQNLHYW